MNVNADTPADPSATWFRWNAGPATAYLRQVRALNPDPADEL